MVPNYEKTIKRVLIPQYKWHQVEEEGRTKLVKTKELQSDEYGRLKIGGVVEDRMFQFQHFLYDSEKYGGAETDYQRKEQYMAQYDWSNPS